MKFKEKSLKILEFGSRPTLLQRLITAPKASEIVTTEQARSSEVAARRSKSIQLETHDRVYFRGGRKV